MLVSHNFVLAISFLATTLAAPVANVPYSPNTKALMGRVKDSWEAAERVVLAFPKVNAKPTDVNNVKAAIDNVTRVCDEMWFSENMNSPFDNVQSAQPYLNDYEAYQGTGANTVPTLRASIPLIRAAAVNHDLEPLYLSIYNLYWRVLTDEWIMDAFPLGNVGGSDLTSPIRAKYRLLPELVLARDALKGITA